MECSLPGSPVHGIFQARILEWVAIPSFRDQTRISRISCIGRRIPYTEPPRKRSNTDGQCQMPHEAKGGRSTSGQLRDTVKQNETKKRSLENFRSLSSKERGQQTRLEKGWKRSRKYQVLQQIQQQGQRSPKALEGNFYSSHRQQEIQTGFFKPNDPSTLIA